ncbi:VOC family protein [Shewanella sp. Isolate11]|uniref:VOC family protein n=1 Tax=Shewanella sp. Isolate11 TaxID=2908530 RepID=UPI001EFC7ED2|nr:VOC family protein [Shewanella sp. Isolate11]MCG9697075.1 VOC family protein [Shewanella sp. Isolate11]
MTQPSAPIAHQTLDSITANDLQQSWARFSAKIGEFLSLLQLDKLNLECDHVALRVNTITAADRLSHYFQTQGKVISNNMINGRPILIFQLDKPLILSSNAIELAIECVELPYPSEKAYPAEGWEHIEIILPGEAQTTQQLQQQLLEVAPQLNEIFEQRTDIKVKHSSPQGEHERLANPTIAFKRADVCIKVHSHSIKAIIASEAQ